MKKSFRYTVVINGRVHAFQTEEEMREFLAEERANLD